MSAPRHLGDALPQLVNRLVASYFEDPRTQHVDQEYLPSRTRAEAINALLLELAYPGVVGRRGLTRHNIAYHVGELLPRLWEQLTDEITQCLCHAAECAGRETDDETHRREAVDRATRFVEQIPDVRTRLTLDAQAHYDGDPAASSVDEVLVAYPGLLATSIYRFAHELYRLNVPTLPRMMSEHAHQLTGIDVHPGATIGRSFCIDHGTGVVIGETTAIGNSVKIYQGVTLGALSFPKDERGRLIRGHKRHPTVGDNVTIYASATILGGETVIGDGAVIGGGVFVTRSVAPGHVVSLSPPVLRIRRPRTAPDGDGPVPPDDFVPDYVI